MVGQAEVARLWSIVLDVILVVVYNSEAEARFQLKGRISQSRGVMFRHMVDKI